MSFVRLSSLFEHGSEYRSVKAAEEAVSKELSYAYKVLTSKGSANQSKQKAEVPPTKKKADHK